MEIVRSDTLALPIAVNNKLPEEFVWHGETSEHRLLGLPTPSNAEALNSMCYYQSLRHGENENIMDKKDPGPSHTFSCSQLGF